MLKRNYYIFLVLFAFLMAFNGCKKDDSTNNTGENYQVAITVVNPAGLPQGGVLVSLKNPPSADSMFKAYTNANGIALLKSPAGQHTFLAQIGSAFTAEITFNVQATNDTSKNKPTTVVKLTQNTNVKVLVVQASAENLEDVLTDPKIGFTNFTLTNIDSLAQVAQADSTKLLADLKQYTLIFTNCDGSTEGGAYYAPLSRVYGRYVESGGKMYGGHYNYYHLQRIWPGYYLIENSFHQSADTLKVIDTRLSGFLGYSVIAWSSADSRNLSGYEKFNDLPANSTVYGVIQGTNPAIAVIVENHIGLGKYLWTDYHNQDIKNEPTLIKIVQYFLLSL